MPFMISIYLLPDLLIEPAKVESLYVGIHAKPLFLGIAALGKSSYLCSRKQEIM